MVSKKKAREERLQAKRDAISAQQGEAPEEESTPAEVVEKEVKKESKEEAKEESK